MTRKKVVVGAIVLFALFFGTVVTNGIAFTQTPTYIDTGGDSTPECTDILKVWFANNANYLQVKLELNGALDQYAWPVYIVYISIDNSTGANYGWDLLVDIYFYIEFSETGTMYSWFYDYTNGSNIHDYPYAVGLMYYLLSNNNHTLEFGYKLQTYDQAYDSRGFLNLSTGQTIYLKVQADTDSDLAPNSGGFIRYVLTDESGIPGFELPFLSLAVLVSVMVYVVAKKKTPI